MNGKMLMGVAVLAAWVIGGTSVATGAITIPTVTIGNPGNAPDGPDHGSVGYTYNVGIYEVTNAQYSAFLNAKAAADPNNLYNGHMGGPFGGITRSGPDGSFVYAAIAGRENHPVNWVSFWDATRFANWLHNGQGSGDTEDGAYTLSGVINPVHTSVTRNPGWQWAVTSEDEWYKAAYYQPASQGGDSGSYWLYPTQGDTITTARANYNNAIGDTTPVGSYSANYFGTFDMGGNVGEWNEAISASGRVVRGGWFGDNGGNLRSDGRGYASSGSDFFSIGFRVVQIPSAGSAALLAIGGVMAGRRRRG